MLASASAFDRDGAELRLGALQLRLRFRPLRHQLRRLEHRDQLAGAHARAAIDADRLHESGDPRIDRDRLIRLQLARQRQRHVRAAARRRGRRQSSAGRPAAALLGLRRPRCRRTRRGRATARRPPRRAADRTNACDRLHAVPCARYALSGSSGSSDGDARPRRLLHERVDRRQHDQRGERGRGQAADDRAAERRGRLRAFADRERHRHHAGDHRRARHQHRPHARPRGVDGRVAAASRRCRRACSANVTSRIAFATATPIAMIAPMNDCTFSVVRVASQHQHDAGQHGRHGRDDDERETQRLEVRGQQQEDHDDRHERDPRVMFVNVSRIARDLTAHASRSPRAAARPPARSPDPRGRRRGPRSSPDDVRRQRHHPLAVDAIVFADDRAVLDARHVAEQRMRRAGPRVTGTTRRSSRLVIRGCGTSTCTWNAMPVRGSAQ